VLWAAGESGECEGDIITGILNWCLAGLAQYYANRNRLVQPKKVSQATTNVRTVSDTVGLFLATECTFEPGTGLSRSAFREIFEKWCAEEGIRRIPSGKKVAEALRERGVVDGGRTNSDRFWSGIRWKTIAERDVSERSRGFQEVLIV
jgi:phage/plasmid-associated DNA primase